MNFILKNYHNFKKREISYLKPLRDGGEIMNHIGVCIGPGPDRPGPKTEMGARFGPRIGPEWTGKCPHWTGPGPAFSAQTCKMARSLARSGRANTHGRVACA